MTRDGDSLVLISHSAVAHRDLNMNLIGSRCCSFIDFGSETQNSYVFFVDLQDLGGCSNRESFDLSGRCDFPT